MRIYVRDVQRRAYEQALMHGFLLTLVIVSIYSGDHWGAWPCWLLLGLFHLGMARDRLQRARELGHVENGYVEVTPGIQVVTLRDRRARTRERSHDTPPN